MPAKIQPEIVDLLQFLNISPTAWHAVDHAIGKLSEIGFKELTEADAWQLKPGGHYYIVRNGSSLCAFVMPASKPESLRLVASHSDSPSFKLKPNAEFRKENMTLLGVEIYGAPLLTSWLNRDLGIAGRIITKGKRGEIEESLVTLDDCPLTIPQLAIHLDRTVNEAGLTLNKQEHLAAIATLDDKPTSKISFLEKILKRHVDFHHLLSFDLFLYPLEKARLMGEDQQMIASYRLDNLAGVHATLTGLLGARKPHPTCVKMIAFWDHEEIGSHSAYGAASPFLPHIIERIARSREDYFRLLSRSLCVSVDLTHALHPNYSDRHEPHHQVLMNHGIVVKENALQRYATDACSSAIIIDLCQKLKIPYQRFVSRNDIPSGSTIGPIHANQTGMSTVDIGYAQLSMHSCRELAGCHDHLDMCKLLTTFLT